MIFVDRVFQGPEVGRTAAARALGELAAILHETDPTNAPCLEFYFVVGGSLGEPEFEGARVVVASPKQQRLRIFIGIPSAVAREIDNLDDAIGMALDGLDAARSRVGAWFPLDTYATTLRSMLTVDSPQRETLPKNAGGHNSCGKSKCGNGFGLGREAD